MKISPRLCFHFAQHLSRNKRGKFLFVSKTKHFERRSFHSELQENETVAQTDWPTVLQIENLISFYSVTRRF